MITWNAKRRHYGRRVLAVIAVACVLGLGFVPVTISPQQPLHLVEQALSHRVGPVDQLEGTVRFRLLPRPALEISQLTLTVNTDVVIAAKQLNVQLRLLPLLGGRYEPTGLTLVEPDFELPLEKVPAQIGETALSFIRFADTVSATPVETSTAHLDFISLVDGTAHAQQRDGVTKPLLSKITATLGLDSANAFSLTGHADWHLHRVDLSVAFGGNPAEAQAGRSVSLSLESDLITLSLTGGLVVVPRPVFEGRLSANIAALNALSSWLAVAPTLRTGTSLSLSGDSTLTESSLSLANAEIKLGQTSFNGGLMLGATSERTLLSATLATSDMEATELLAPLWPKATASGGWKTEPIDNDLLPNLDLDVRLSAERVNLGITRVADVALAFMQKDRRLDITLASAKLFQGTAKGKLSVAPSEAGYSVKTHGSFNDIDIAQATLAAMDIKKIEGQASGTFTLESDGGTGEQLMKALSGEAESELKDGTLIGINLSNILKRIESRPLAVTFDLRGGKTDFDTAKTAVHILDGRARLDEMRISAANYQLKLAGIVDIGARDLKLQGLATAPPSRVPGDPILLPFTVTGPFDDPDVTPDIKRILLHQGAPDTAVE